MWTCPECRQQFVNKNQSHSCVQTTLHAFLADKPAQSIALFESFIAEYRKIGEFTLHPVKTRIALLCEMRFCAINHFGTEYLDVHFVLTENLDRENVFRKVENFKDRFFVHHLRIFKPEQITPFIRMVMQKAYAVGNREHIL